ncbi:hypothetical protein RCO28_24420 [Streptomyces sp. LHD-70]|uniref:hypothetical protein n=1 Tax=Streptomyces sp. LHD-70 TaxID=3072140 RepID=UPI00280F7DE1|nr:hypothetical protein [Streptomyces sp. LHD-70]MDQ8705617.1 hypothetical protein [Streptomyces sp. LHD-70]
MDRPTYLAPWINDLVPGSAQAARYAVGVIEIIGAVAPARLAQRCHREPISR